VPTRSDVRSGVVTHAMSVLAVVIMILRGMSPRAMYATILEAVPPGMQETYKSRGGSKVWEEGWNPCCGIKTCMLHYWM
jgi:hypothetical protein